MKAWGIEIASETQLRKLSVQQLGTHLTGEAAPFAFSLENGVDIRLAPLVYVCDIVANIIQVLEQNDKVGCQ